MQRVCGSRSRIDTKKKKIFLAIESPRISLKLNVSAAGEQQAVDLGPFVQLHQG